MILTFAWLPDNIIAQEYPLRTIEEIQFVLHPEVNDQSFLLGDTVEVGGLVMSDVRGQAIGSNRACFVVDPTLPTDPWQGFLAVQNDTTMSGTRFGNLQKGMICRFTGVIREIETATQLILLTDPLIPVVIESAGNFLPQPLMPGTDDLTNLQNGEQWESQLVRISDATVTDNLYSSNRAVIEEISGLPTYMDDYFSFYNDMFTVIQLAGHHLAPSLMSRAK